MKLGKLDENLIWQNSSFISDFDEWPIGTAALDRLVHRGIQICNKGK
jgi:hypothetical protein